MPKHAADNKPVTIKSIAEALQISFSTVSKALNNNPLIKDETRDLVMKKAQEMGYTPNSLARGLRSSSTKTIAIIFNDIENPVLTYVFRNISIAMAEFGYTTMIFDSQFNEKIERNNIVAVLSRLPDFIIIEPASMNKENLKLLAGMKNKVSIQGKKFTDIICHRVEVDYFKGGYISASELLANGHRDIVVLTETLSFPTSKEFVDGIKKAFDEYGIPFDDQRVMTGHSSIEGGFKIMQSFRDSQTQSWTIPITGVITFDDNLAFGVYKSAQINKLTIPEDISIIGFDDNPLSAFSSPPLTTMHLPKEKMAEHHLDIITAILLKERTEICLCSTEPVLVKRGSVKNIVS